MMEMLSYICLNPWNARHQEWTLTWTMDLWWLLCLYRFIRCSKSFTLCWQWGSYGVWGQGREGNLCACPTPPAPERKLYEILVRHWWLYIQTSLVVQWLRICLPAQETWVLSLPSEDPTGCVTCTIYLKNIFSIIGLQNTQNFLLFQFLAIE